MLSSAKNYVAVPEKIEEDLNISEENKDESTATYCSESLLENSHFSDSEETQNAQGIGVAKLASNSDEAIQGDWEETSDNTIGEEELSDNQIISDTDNKADDNLTSASGVSKTSTSDSSENLLISNQRRELSVDDGDEGFPLVSRKANSADDLLDKNFVKWAHAGGNTLRNNGDKESTMTSESPSSDVEFSACSSVTSCTEDSGISSTVRDDELEEIPLNSSRFSPELYKQISRLSVDESVAAWIPKSSNTYAPSPNSNANVTTDTDGGKSQKQSKLK